MSTVDLPADGWVRFPQVLKVVPFRESKLKLEIKAGRFPAPKRFGEYGRIVAFDAREVHRWIAEQREAA